MNLGFVFFVCVFVCLFKGSLRDLLFFVGFKLCK